MPSRRAGHSTGSAATGGRPDAASVTHFRHACATGAANSGRAVSREEMLANVWNWDPTWSVVWYEDGDRRGAMAQRVGLDPLSVELHTGPDLPSRRGWVEPRPTRHLFYAPVNPGAREVTVEAIDGFGRSYTEVLRLG